MRVTELPASPPLKEYAKVVGEEEIEQLKERAERIKGIRLQEVNSARYGGGVAEMLLSYVPFLQNLGLDAQWTVLDAKPEFYDATKTLHNFLQGEGGCFSLEKSRVYWMTMKENLSILEDDRDIITIHDPQPAGLIDLVPSAERARKWWIWRCHIHLETIRAPRLTTIAEFLRPTIERYDAAIFSSFQFLPLWSVPTFVIPPFIDPLSDKNKELDAKEVEAVRDKYGLHPKKPLITQVSRFDWAKDPLGVIAAFKMVREKVPCQLVLAGGGATDDPEYQQVLQAVRNAARKEKDIHILDLPPNSYREINAIQRASDIIVQKSVREGFGLTVTEGLWKGKPVVGGRVGGIQLQIIDGWNGFLVSNVEETAVRILYLLKNPEMAREMGIRGREHVRRHFLLTRGVKEHLTTIDQLVNGRMVSKSMIITYHPWLKEMVQELPGLSGVEWLL